MEGPNQSESCILLPYTLRVYGSKIQLFYVQYVYVRYSYGTV